MTHRFWAKILIWGVLIAPLTLLVYRQQTVYPLIFLKVFVFQAIVSILFVIWLALILRYPEYRPKLTVVHITLGIWLLALIVTAFNGVNLAHSLWSTQDRAIGIVFILHMAAFCLMLQTAVKNIGWRQFMNYLAAIGLVMALLGFMNRIAPVIFYAMPGARPGGTLGNPSFLAAYLLFMLGFGAWLFATAPRQGERQQSNIRPWPLLWIAGGVAVMAGVYISKTDDIANIIGLAAIVWGAYQWLKVAEGASRFWYRVTLAAIMAIQLALLFLANTRGALLALVFALGLLLVLRVWRDLRSPGGWSRAYRSPAAVVLALLIVLGGTFVATRSAKIWQSVPGFDRLAQLSTGDATVNNRKVVWGIAAESIKERPLLGWGTDNFRYPFDLRYDPTLLNSNSDETYWDKPHNVFLESLVTSGGVGFVAYLAFLLTIFLAVRRSDERFRPFGYAILAAYLVQNFVIFDSFATYLMLFIFIAFVSENRMPAKETAALPAGRPVKLPVTIAVLAGALFVSVWMLRTDAVTIYGNTLQYQGLNYFVNRLPDEAIAAYRKGFSLNYPYAGEIRQSYVASLKQLIGQIEIVKVAQAIQLGLDEYPKAIAADPYNHFSHFTIADARTTFYRVDKKFLAGAQEEIEMAEKFSPRRQQIFYVRSRIRLALGDTAGGLAEMQRAIDLAPDVGEPHFFHALLNVGTGTIDEINRELVLALDQGFEPVNLQQLRLVVQYFLLNEQYALGADYLDEFKEVPYSMRLEHQLYLGQFAFKDNQYERARIAFQNVADEFSLFLMTDRFNTEFKSMFAAVGIEPSSAQGTE